MSWIAVLLLGLALADLGHSVRPVQIVPECIAAGVAVLVGVLCDLTGGRDILALVVIAAVVVAWGLTVRQGFGRDHPSWPLLLVGMLAWARGRRGRWPGRKALCCLYRCSRSVF